MEIPIATDFRGSRCARSNTFADGYMLWMAPLLIAFDHRPGLAPSLIAALALLLAAAVFWADGRGRSESWAEALFAFGWMGIWAPAGGLLLQDLDRGGDLGGLWAALCLAAGAAVLAWSWRSRHRRPALEGAAATPRSHSGTDALVWLGAGAVLLLLAGVSRSLHWADAAVLGLAFVLHLLLTPRGRAARACGAPW